ncbi:DNA dC-_dU-editing enzyme APOBEC-3A-like isoform X1 [Halichoerus grypus]
MPVQPLPGALMAYKAPGSLKSTPRGQHRRDEAEKPRTQSQRHLLDEDTFTENFRNDNWPPRTYLCYKVERPDQGSGVPPGQDKGILRNKSAQRPELPCHAESRLLEQIQSWDLDPRLRYGVTCFLSWSPCTDCAQAMAQFLEENSHVSLSLFASRLYTRGHYDEGLRALKRAGASIAIMTSREFEHCWNAFVHHEGNRSPPCHQPWRVRNSLRNCRAFSGEPEGWTSVWLKTTGHLCEPQNKTLPPKKCKLALHHHLHIDAKKPAEGNESRRSCL